MLELKKAVEAAGGVAVVAESCGITQRAIYKWLTSGRLPRTEYTGETAYAEKIAALATAKGTPLDGLSLLASISPAKCAP